MDWIALEKHFRDAAAPEPGPFGDDAIEWDYSRYARALGLTGEPGAHDLPHRGCAVVALAPTRWDPAEKKLRAWASQQGWDLWRFSARPTVAVPDPVAYALGTRAAGADSFIFARAAPPVVPAMGRRPRSGGMSFPLTPGERWLIATDRVRRRMRAEIGMRGVVLFVDEAEWLTPAGLGLLMYLLDAHRAWRARMLSRPARVYVVLATAPEHEAGVVRMLERFHLKGHPPVLRERRRAAATAAQPAPTALRDVEEEYLFGALAAAPAALAAEDVRAVFGESAVERCRAMVERGLLRERTEAGRLCYATNPAVRPTASPPRRALAGIAARYRQMARRGHEHLVLAAAGLSVAMEGTRRAMAAVARMPHTAGALLPLRLFETVDGALEHARSGLRADHIASWFSLVAHQRAYDRARDLADAITAHDLGTWREALRVVRVVLCTGRVHLDGCLPQDFWPRLKSRRLAGPFMDATCVLGELFWRKRYLDNTDIRQRYEFACECFARAAADRPRSPWFDRLERIGQLVIYRAALHLDTPTEILSSGGAGPGTARPVTLRAFLRTHQMPAFITAAPMFAESASGQVSVPRSFDGADRYFAVVLGATTGQPADLAVTTATGGVHLYMRGVRLLLRDLFDDLLISIPRRMNASDRHDLGRILSSVAGGRGWLVTTTAINLRHGCRDVPGRDAFDELAVADALLCAGDFVGARDRLMVGLARTAQCPFLLASAIAMHAVLARKSLDVGLLGVSRALVDQHALTLGVPLCRYLGAFLEASEALCVAKFSLAERSFAQAYEALKGTRERARELKEAAILGSVRARYAREVVRASASGSGRGLWSVIRRLCTGDDWQKTAPALRTRAAVCLDYLCGIIDAWARAERDNEQILRLALFLKGAVDEAFRPTGRDFLGVMAQWAPRFYERLRTAVVDTVGELGVAAPEARALGASIRTIEEAWRNRHDPEVDERCDRVRLYTNQSHARLARNISTTWYDDATTYASLWDERGGIRGSVGGSQTVLAYGHFSRSGAKPVATALRFQITPVPGGGFDVVPQAEAAPSRSPRKKPRAHPVDGMALLVGRSAGLEKVRALIEAAARCSYPVLILGETGVGKELVAKCIHSMSGRQEKQLIVAECGGMVDSLLESELFGHEKGAFTGACASHEGLFERANGSSLLLDEADSMSNRTQAALLRVLETGEYRRVGASRSRRSEFRLMTAALPRLLRMVDAREFRQDLFYRISTLRIEIPPLREREGDAEEIAVAHARSLGMRLTQGARSVIASYDWPGNVRQLRHCIHAAGLHANDGRIGEAAMDEVVAGYRGGPRDDSSPRADADAKWARALGTLERMKHFGAWDFAKAADLSRRSAQRHIARLLREGRIVRVGAGRSTQYGFPGDAVSA